MAGVNERWPGVKWFVQMKRECRDRAESKEQMDSVHSCLARSSAWQAGCGLARGEDRGEPLNVHPLRSTPVIYTYCYSNDQQKGLKIKSDIHSYSIIAARGQLRAMYLHHVQHLSPTCLD